MNQQVILLAWIVAPSLPMPMIIPSLNLIHAVRHTWTPTVVLVKVINQPWENDLAIEHWLAGIGCVFTNNACAFDRTLKCTDLWGTTYKAGLLESLSCGATKGDKCPTSCNNAAANMYAALRLHEKLDSFVSYTDLYFTMASWSKSKQNQVAVDFAVCASEVTTQAALSANSFSADSCVISDTVLQDAYTSAVQGNTNSTANTRSGNGSVQAGSATGLTMWLPVVATLFIIGLATLQAFI